MATLGSLIRKQEMLKKYRDAATNTIQEQKNNTLSQMESDNTAAITKENDSLNKSLQEAYLTKQNSLKNLPQIMAARGYNGGMSETTEAGILNGYQNSRNTLNLDSQGRVGDLMREYNQKRADAQLEYGSKLTDKQLDYDAQLAELEDSILAAKAAATRKSSGGGGGGGTQTLELGGWQNGGLINSAMASAVAKKTQEGISYGLTEDEIVNALNRYFNNARKPKIIGI